MLPGFAALPAQETGFFLKNPVSYIRLSVFTEHILLTPKNLDITHYATVFSIDSIFPLRDQRPDL